MERNQATGPRRPLVFCDSGCPLCRREIDHYRRQDRGQCMEWVDIQDGQETLAGHGLTPAQAMARLHLLDDLGQWHTGAWAFAALWERLPGYRWAARLLRLLRLLPLPEAAYRPFARWRLQRRCADDLCSTRSG